MKILFAGYRDWARGALLKFYLSDSKERCSIEFVETPERLDEELETKTYDLVFLAGWSWIVPKELCEKHFIVGVHPSDLPSYAGGSPIQHQILAGISNTKMSVFRISPVLDGGGILYKTDLCLDGNMDDIFESLKWATVDCLKHLVDNWPNVEEKKQDHREKPLRRLLPKDSELTIDRFQSMNAKQLYDFMRCREYPYPNVYIEDDSGKLLIERVHFLHKNKLEKGTRVKLTKWYIKQLATTNSDAHAREFESQIGTVMDPMFDDEELLVNVLWDSGLRYGYFTHDLDIVEEQ